ncbi:hypothetical protein ABZ938_24155 [Streptomyces sp. NPDC046409]|uniref:LexA family protein n=1 Tax=Streptomyces sp. NPDC046409 TaxID=3156675 RepID=UPI0033FF17FC
MTGDAPLSARQESILQAIKAAITESGEAPSLRQIAERVGLTSASSVHYQLGRLEERGLGSFVWIIGLTRGRCLRCGVRPGRWSRSSHSGWRYPATASSG